MGSRWREMLMDYGRVLGDRSHKSSKTSSAFFSVDGDLDERRDADARLRRTLELHFRPLFQRFVYGGEKLACHDLRRLLQDPVYRDKLPPDKVHELADLADFNRGRAVKYDEFVRIVLGKSEHASSFGGSFDDDFASSKEPGKLANGLRVVCRNTAQQMLVDERVDSYRCLPPPFFMILVSLAQIAAYVYYAVNDDADVEPLEGVPTNNTLMYMPTRRREAWRFVTYWLLHQGYIDLICNILLQLGLGIPLEITFSWWRMCIVYFLGVIAGSLGQSLTDHYVGLVGGAGGALAITGAHLIALWQNRSFLNDDDTETKTKKMVCSVSLRVIIILLVVIPQVGLAVYRRWIYDTPITIGIAAHVGGLVAGFLLGQAFMKDNKRYPWQDGAGYLDLFVFLIFTGACIIFNIVWTKYPDEDYS